MSLKYEPSSVFKAHRLLHHSALGVRVMKTKKKSWTAIQGRVHDYMKTVCPNDPGRCGLGAISRRVPHVVVVVVCVFVFMCVCVCVCVCVNTNALATGASARLRVHGVPIRRS